jgi:hypothetical protein
MMNGGLGSMNHTQKALVQVGAFAENGRQINFEWAF